MIRGLVASVLASVGLLVSTGTFSVGQERLAGKLLVATDDLRDPRFAQTVIVMVQHDADGAMGLVVNRPLGETSLARLLELFGIANPGAAGRVRVFYGGPVEPMRAFVLHTADWMGPESRALGGAMAISAHPEILDAIGEGKGPRRSLVALGYAGWAPGQLEGEIRRGAWISVPADEALVFDEKHGTKWERAMARRRLSI